MELAGIISSIYLHYLGETYAAVQITRQQKDPSHIDWGLFLIAGLGFEPRTSGL
jgi:hypothetical protein